ncbi:four helix bundle protein [Roseovarius nitratireducens]|uniref:four helix bundle protein n=1 Tax=Roseovarius nitratireducens TaxID=2044597 RepID=UPI000CE2102A|nr:four helix bundle protein [Roseovarius nitratireducens]
MQTQKCNHPEASILHKCREVIKLLNVHLNHFPRHERYGLCQQIRGAMYDVYALIVECHKRYHNKTSLTRLDVRHEQLRMLVNLAFEMGYYAFHDNKRGRAESEALRRYTAASILINEVGAMIGGWIRSLRGADRAGA